MKLIWYDGTLQEVSDSRFYQSFRDYILIPYQEDRKNKIDELEDEILDEQDELLEERGQSYTKETEEYLKKTSRKTLDKLMSASLKELVTDIPLGKLSGAIGEDFPDDYKLKDVRNSSKTEQLITPFEEKDALEQEYTKKDFEKRLQEAVFAEKSKLKNFLTYDKDSPENKIVLKFNMRSDTPEEEHGKIRWYESLGIEVALHKPDDKRAPRDTGSSIVAISDELKGTLRMKPDEPEKLKEGETRTEFEKVLIDSIFEDKSDFQRIIMNNIPEKILDKNYLYDFTMELTILLKAIPESKLYEIDDRRTIRIPTTITNEKGEPETIYDTEDNPNYGKFKLDDEGEKIPKFEGDELDNLVEIRTVFRATKTATLKPRTTMAATTGQTERVRGLGRAGMTAGRAGEFTADKINMARKYYLNLLKARLEKLEEAISKIPVAKEA